MKILFLDTTHHILEDGLRAMGFDIDFDYTSPPEEIYKKVGKYHGLILRSRMKVDETFLSHAISLRFIGRFGAGLENIDVELAKGLGINCIRVPEGNCDVVAEHAMGMLLSLFSNILRADREVRQGIWHRKENTGVELQGKTVGIIGYGYMGSAFVDRLHGFDCKVLIYDKYKSRYAPEWAFETSLRAIFENADIVSLHVPLTKETRNLVNRDFLLQFRKPIYLINTARGPVVNTEALVEALKSKKVLGACLDVLEYEKNSFENLFSEGEVPAALAYLTQADNVVLTPHIAGWSHESFAKMAEAMVEKITRLMPES
jgi:D-3-phosphoglycerate dehydrogenase